MIQQTPAYIDPLVPVLKGQMMLVRIDGQTSHVAAITQADGTVRHIPFSYWVDTGRVPSHRPKEGCTVGCFSPAQIASLAPA